MQFENSSKIKWIILKKTLNTYCFAIVKNSKPKDSGKLLQDYLAALGDPKVRDFQPNRCAI
ncbi:MAG: hypothetical protein CMC35_05335 [Flavobacteriaceae bacterium]|nr:hypothetical protein [Flavobacteriaceae bacterium]